MRKSARCKWLWAAVAVAASVLVAWGCVWAASERPTLTGQVTAVKGTQPFTLPGIPDVTVTAEPGGKTTKTDRRGRFGLHLAPGLYELTFRGEGLEAYSQKVMVTEAAPASVTVALFPDPQGPPVAVLKPGGRAPVKGPVPYNTTVYLDASGSQNLSRQGIRWEIRDEQGRVVNDPYAVPARPLQLEPSPIPGSSPLEFTFTPPRPGKFVVRLLLQNRFSDGQESVSEQVVVAENTAPEPLPGVFAGPNPPAKTPSGERKKSAGLTTVTAGSPVYLAGWALDKNAPAPELYNPAGRKPDSYGKNDDHGQSRFGWQWRLEYVDPSGKRSDVTSLLQAEGGVAPAAAQYPWFVAGQPGEYVAFLAVEDRDPSGSLVSEPVPLTIKVLPKEGATVTEASCIAEGCHSTIGGRPVSAGGPAGAGMPCQSCHGPGLLHLAATDAAGKRGTMAVSYAAGQCGQCHGEYAEWEKSRHADGYPFGFYEVAQPLLLNCAKCHYPQGFADALNTAQEKKTSFGEVEFKKPMFPGGPLFFDFAKTPEKVGKGVSCQACHDPHRIAQDNPEGLRVPKDQLCGTCHEEKWQNVLLRQTAGRVGSAFEYPGEKYPKQNPHDTPEQCVLCHMDTSVAEKDAAGVRRLGGHTMRLRDAGPDGRLGGFGPSSDDPSRLREEYGADDRLNTQVCRKCHADLESFDYRSRQSEIYKLWTELGQLLRKHNKGVLPGYKPGDKCATCHRGGTLPFDEDPHLILENAYTNYKLVMNDRSWGVHNYEYTKKLLVDSLKSVRELP